MNHNRLAIEILNAWHAQTTDLVLISSDDLRLLEDIIAARLRPYALRLNRAERVVLILEELLAHLNDRPTPSVYPYLERMGAALREEGPC